MFYQCHREGFELPIGGYLLASGQLFANQAFRYGENAFCIQFHPEVLASDINRWLERGEKRLVAPGARQAGTHLSDFVRCDSAVDHWVSRFISTIFKSA